MRSCTAETIYAEEGYPVRSAGTEIEASVTLNNEIILWADFDLRHGRKTKSNY